MTRWLAMLAMVGCSSPPTAAVAPTAPPSGRNQDSHRGFVGQRQSEVPRSSDPAERIVFTRAGSVWIMGPDGDDPSQISVRSLDGADQAPVISPDGTRVAYISPHAGVPVLVVTGLADLIPEPVTSPELGPVGEPSWSPDGTRLALMRGDPRVTRDLILVPSGGGEMRVLVAGDDDKPELVGGPVFTADGRSIIFAADRRKRRGTTLWKVDIETGALSQVTRGVDGGFHFRDRSPALTPDGESIVFSSNRHATSPDHADDDELYVLHHRAGGQVMRLTEGPGSCLDPAVSPDGQRIVFVSTRSSARKFETELFVMSIRGGAAARLTRDPSPQNLAPFVGRVR